MSLGVSWRDHSGSEHQIVASGSSGRGVARDVVLETAARVSVY